MVLLYFIYEFVNSSNVALFSLLSECLAWYVLEDSLELRASKTYPDNGYYLSSQVSLEEMSENLFPNFRGNCLTE